MTTGKFRSCLRRNLAASPNDHNETWALSISIPFDQRLRLSTGSDELRVGSVEHPTGLTSCLMQTTSRDARLYAAALVGTCLVPRA